MELYSQPSTPEFWLQIHTVTVLVSCVGSDDPGSACSIFVETDEANPGRRVFLCFFQGVRTALSFAADKSSISLLLTMAKAETDFGAENIMSKRTCLTLLPTLAPAGVPESNFVQRRCSNCEQKRPFSVNRF